MLWTGNCGSAAWGSEREDPCTSGTKAWRIVVPQVDKSMCWYAFLGEQAHIISSSIVEWLCIYKNYT